MSSSFKNANLNRETGITLGKKKNLYTFYNLI